MFHLTFKCFQEKLDFTFIPLLEVLCFGGQKKMMFDISSVWTVFLEFKKIKPTITFDVEYFVDFLIIANVEFKN